MSKPGPKPEPAEIKLIKGNPGKRPIEPSPQPTPVAPKPPSWLLPEAKKRWKELAPELEQLGLLTKADGLTFSMMLTHYALAVDALRQLKSWKKEIGNLGYNDLPLTIKRSIDKLPLVIKGSKDTYLANPLLRILRDHSALFKAYMAEFGLSPSSRVGFSVPDQSSEWDEFFND
jgi:phage terminase small subunit